MHIKQKTKQQNGSNGKLNFLSFSTEKHNVYNIYVAINVPSFFKLNCMCIYFSHRANTFVSVPSPYLHLHFLRSMKFYFMN